MAREFDRDLTLLLLDQPTRGLDVGSIEFIHRQIIAKRDAGTAVLLVSAELDEVLEMSDRIAVMYRGALVAVRDGRTADKNEIGLLMATGGRTRPRTRRSAGDRHEPRGARRSPTVGGACGPCLAVPLVAIVLALIVGAVVIVDLQPARLGHSLRPRPARSRPTAPSSAARWAASTALVETCVQAAPLLLAGLGVGLGFKAGLFNIGAQGQFLLGALAAVWIGLGHGATPRRSSRSRSRSSAAIVGGRCWAGIAGYLKAASGAHEVVTTIMLNYIALAVLSWLVVRARCADRTRRSR